MVCHKCKKGYTYLNMQRNCLACDNRKIHEAWLCLENKMEIEKEGTCLYFSPFY